MTRASTLRELQREDASLQWTGQPEPHCIKHGGSLLISQHSLCCWGWVTTARPRIYGSTEPQTSSESEHKSSANVRHLGHKSHTTAARVGVCEREKVSSSCHISVDVEHWQSWAAPESAITLLDLLLLFHTFTRQQQQQQQHSFGKFNCSVLRLLKDTKLYTTG